jgi:hypothetical protein
VYFEAYVIHIHDLYIFHGTVDFEIVFITAICVVHVVKCFQYLQAKFASFQMVNSLSEICFA